MRGRRAWALLAAIAAGTAAAQSPPPAPPRSAVFDHQAAASLRARVDFTAVIIVEGVDDERRRRPKPIEQRFAEALDPPAPYFNPERLTAIFGDGPPCLSLPSQHVPFGGSYNPHGFCP